MTDRLAQYERLLKRRRLKNLEREIERRTARLARSRSHVAERVEPRDETRWAAWDVEILNLKKAAADLRCELWGNRDAEV